MSLDAHFATPVILTPDMNLEEFQYEFKRMMLRADATRAWLNGQLATDDLLGVWEETGVDSFDACKALAQGQTFM